ncbi:RNA recognition motif domain-containing protein [Dactylococcopsis salina]|uniref:RNA recognition motif protein n=1 Tax=Dactylococcopsis salina (strain PCC 8305) TaxID=13035 RepID=K9YXL4_DACS8|nr:RNA recognition motif protein [Dactylococcopsis salina]AFZ51075.1 RNA recognition motif protein [Dactylococcopsis salina PCC 8305]
MSVRLYVGNLPKDTVERQELQEVFGEANDSLSIKVIKDRKTGNCRGFAFVTVATDEMADEIIEKHNGQTFRENALKIEKALPRNKGKGDENSPSQEKEGSEEKPRETSRPVKQKDKAPDKSSEKESAPKSERRGKKNKKSKQPAASTNNNSNTSTQPDPRWADELAELKKRLSAVEK